MRNLTFITSLLMILVFLFILLAVTKSCSYIIEKDPDWVYNTVQQGYPYGSEVEEMTSADENVYLDQESATSSEEISNNTLSQSNKTLAQNDQENDSNQEESLPENSGSSKDEVKPLNKLADQAGKSLEEAKEKAKQAIEAKKVLRQAPIVNTKKEESKASERRMTIDTDRSSSDKLYFVVVGSFKSSSNAEKFNNKIVDLGYQGYIVSFINRKEDAKGLETVVAGRFKDAQSAKELKNQLISKHQIDAYVIKR